MSELGLRLGRLLNRRPEMWRPFRYKQYGEGSPVVIIPGLDGVTEFFADITPQLTPHHRVIVYYLPLLAEAQAAGVPYTFDFIVSDLKAVLDELHIDKTHVIGESFGGAVAQSFVLAHPDDGRTPHPHLDVRPLRAAAAHAAGALACSRTCPRRCSPACTWATSASGTTPKWAKEVFIRGAAWADHQSVSGPRHDPRRLRPAEIAWARSAARPCWSSAAPIT